MINDCKSLSTQEFEKKIYSLPIIIWLTEKNGSCSYLSRQWYRLTGQSKDQALGFGWLNAIHPDDRTRMSKKLLAAHIDKGLFRAEFRIKTGAEKYRWYLASGNPRYDQDLLYIGLAGTLMDNQDTKTENQDLVSRRDTADHAHQSKIEFLANMSHEIRTPLGAILGFVELLKGPLSAQERSKYYLIIDRNGKALTQIIDDILDLSKAEAGRLEIETKDFYLSVLVDEVIALYKDLTEAKGLALRVEYVEEVPKVVHSDPIRVRQILINIIGNAVKFTSRGTVLIEILPVFRNKELGQIQFVITDTGMGLSNDQIGQLFTVFSQGDNSATRKFGGTGLGLVLSRRLAIALDGDVWVRESTLGQGSVFVVTVGAKGVSRRSMPKNNKVVTKNKMAAAAVLKILLVEDSIDNQVLVENVLLGAGMKVMIAKNGKEALDMIGRNTFDIVLMDMQMPVLDGYQTTSQLRRSGYCKPVIALTSHAMDEEKQKTLLAGCDAHLTKPLDFENLIQTIADYAGDGYGPH